MNDKLTDRLRGKYAMGYTSIQPELDYRQYETPPIQHEAADRIEMLEKALLLIYENSEDVGVCLTAKLALENALNGI